MGLNRRYIMRRKINEPRIVEEAVEKVEFKEEAPLQQIEEKSETIQSEVIEHDETGVKKIVSEDEVLDERVICLNTNEIFADNKEAGEKMDVSAGSIKRCCNGDTKSAGKDKDGNKLVWKYVRDL